MGEGGREGGRQGVRVTVLPPELLHDFREVVKLVDVR